MTMLGRGKRSPKDKNAPKDAGKKPATKADKAAEEAEEAADRAAKAEERAAKAEEAAEAARLAEEAAAKAKEAARLAQIAADEAAVEAEEAEEAEGPEDPEGDSEEDVRALEEPRRARKVSEGASDGDDAAEDDSDASEATSADAEPVEDAEDTENDDEDDEDDEGEEGEDEPRRRIRAGGLSTVIVVLAVLTIALGAGTTMLAMKVGEQRATEAAAKEASMASSRAAQKLSSYDYQTLDADLKAASATTTGKLRTQYEKLAQELKTVAVRQQAISTTTVMKVGVVSATPDKVVTLVYANRSSVTKDDKEQRLPEPLRIKMTMVEDDGTWLASELTVIS
ncbi:hypothetical protein [Spirillospora sp. NPDC048819]|uniref:hypothetical protein n=1 Tax=Spirillospora sp. NPDC048819 TaxID=3155268 RepID=UPI0033D8F560